MVFELPEDTDLPETLAVFLVPFIRLAEGVAPGGESGEFAIVLTEGFWSGEEHQPEPIVLDSRFATIGIGGTDPKVDMAWAELLNRYYNLARRRKGEVKIRRVAMP